MKVLILVALSVILCAHKAAPKSVYASDEDEGVIAFTPYIVNGVRSTHLPYFAHITFRSNFLKLPKVLELINLFLILFRCRWCWILWWWCFGYSYTCYHSSYKYYGLQ